MTWIKLDDSFTEHPKYLMAGPLAAYLNICAIAWSRRNLTDGFIPSAQIARLVNWGSVKVKLPALVEALLRSQLWHEAEGGYLIHDYHDWQDSRDEVLALREEARNRMRTRRAQQRDNGGSSPEHPANIAESSDNVRPLESREERVETPSSTTSQNNRAILAALFTYWQESCNHKAAKLTREREQRMRARLREGYTEEQIRLAIDGAAKAPFVNDNGKRFDDIELICRTGSKLESFMERAGMSALSGRRRRSDDYKQFYEESAQ